MEAKQPKETKQNQKKPQEPKIISKITLKNIDPNINKSQEEILTTIKDLLKDRTDIKNIFISHYDYIYIVIIFNRYLESETEFLNIIKSINKNISALMSYTYKDNENQTDAKKLIYKYCYKPVQKTIFINDDD